MAASKHWAMTPDMRLWLEVAGTRFELSHFTSSFALNEIPTATCILAVGVKAHNLDEAAPIHTVEAESLRIMQPAQVYGIINGEYDPSGRPWPGTKMLLFDGLFMGVSPRKTRGQVQMAVSLTHWLAKLAMSSTLSRESLPGNPANLTYEVFHTTLSHGSGATGVPANMVQHTDFDDIEHSILDDLWGSIKRLFERTARIDSLLQVGLEAIVLPEETGENVAALSALARFEGPGDETSLDYKWAFPLTFQEDINWASLQNAVAEFVGEAPLTAYAATTFWDVLVGQLAPQFNFAIVPRVDTALVVPATAAPREFWQKRISQNEYVSIDGTPTVCRPLRGVGIFAMLPSLVGATDEALNELPPTLGGAFKVELPESVRELGAAMFVRPPPWLSRVDYIEDFVAETSGVMKVVATPTATTPDARPEITKDQPQTQFSRAATLYDRLAESLYVDENLRGRTTIVSGKLRFDIAPGSAVLVEGAPEKFLGEAGQDEAGRDVYGTVIRVTITMDAEASIAYTNFQLSHARTSVENVQKGTSLEGHPIFDTVFLGAPLVDELLFSDEE